ncbi:protein of unknown function [Taphrina deformans PYCC 5710]|uniref:Uncharacterized protein n=1 Tax=Taphrina deformans (strain PYCC 5710 / ATCC 11124 / CBS 356.35 / IMI 108563 / JCM 9778 / NBRC 8474) TaxID=1097556 RepID=R4XGM5_TAPDE|nr:protein of unknown function [Taphrina deformans PYCC 5710]|eukprot:CCG84946.1 protein of unknown function [Taphrina deformans PYCC 5710]
MQQNDYPVNVTRMDTFKMRIHHFTFAWFASTMSTGGLAVTINSMPLYFGTAQYVLGVTVFIIDLIIFTMWVHVILANTTAADCRIVSHRS